MALEATLVRFFDQHETAWRTISRALGLSPSQSHLVLALYRARTGDGMSYEELDAKIPLGFSTAGRQRQDPEFRSTNTIKSFVHVIRKRHPDLLVPNSGNRYIGVALTPAGRKRIRRLLETAQ